MGAVYSITNIISGAAYIGSTINRVTKRWGEHRKALAAGTHHSRHLQRAWNKYGRDAFVFAVIEDVVAGAVLEREQFHMDRVRAMGARMSYNACPTAGNFTGYRFTAAQRANLSLAHVGISRSEESKIKQSDYWAEHHCKPMDLVGPDGTVYRDVRNCRRFCREHGICQSAFQAILSGRGREYKGWRVAGVPGRPKLSFVAPDGQIYRGIASLKKFCVARGLAYKKMSAVNTGSSLSYHGWRKGEVVGIPHKTWSQRPRRRLRIGSSKTMAKLDEASVAEDRRAYAAGSFSLQALADFRGVSVRTMGKAIRGDTWKHVA